MPKNKKKDRKYMGTVTITCDVEIGQVPAKNEKQARQIMRAMAEAGVACGRGTWATKIRLWRQRDGTYGTFGRGAPTVLLKYPDMVYGAPQTEVDFIDEDGEGDGEESAPRG